jgi:hypothetical protein
MCGELLAFVSLARSARTEVWNCTEILYHEDIVVSYVACRLQFGALVKNVKHSWNSDSHHESIS